MAVVIGIVLLADGWLRLVLYEDGRSGDRRTTVINSAATAGYGAMALAWPDATVPLVALLFAARTVLSGVESLLVDALPDARPQPDGVRRPPIDSVSALRTMGPWAAATALLAVGLTAHAL